MQKCYESSLTLQWVLRKCLCNEDIGLVQNFEKKESSASRIYGPYSGRILLLGTTGALSPNPANLHVKQPVQYTHYLTIHHKTF